MTDKSPSALPRLVAFMTPMGAWRFFRSLAAACPGSRLLWRAPWSFRRYPETPEVAASALVTYLETARPYHWTRWLPRDLSLRLLGWRCRLVALSAGSLVGWSVAAPVDGAVEVAAELREVLDG
jgi:hypothetical protein